MENDGNFIVIEPPFSIDFTAQRGLGSAINSMSLTIYNLGKENRERIFQDRFSLEIKPIILEVGYNNQLTTIFSGNLFQASSSRRGTEIVTEIDARDNFVDLTTTLSNKTLESGVTLQDVYGGLIDDFPNIIRGVIGGENITFNRPIILNGNTYDIIQNYSNNNAYVDNGVCNILNPNQAIEGVVTVINSETGLLETPRREDASLVVKTLCQPKIKMGQIIDLESEILPVYNGQYKVYGVTHRGTISEAVGGMFESEFNLFLGSKVYGAYDILSL